MVSTVMFLRKDIYIDGHLTLLNSEVSFDLKSVQIIRQCRENGTHSLTVQCATKSKPEV